MKQILLSACAATLWACATVQPPEDEPIAEPDVPGATKAEPVVPITAAVAPKPVADPPPVTSPFHVIGKGDVSFGLHRSIDGALMVSAGPLVMRVDEAGEVLYDLSMLRGIEPIRKASVLEGGYYDGVMGWQPVGLGGRWPDALFMSLDFSSGFRGEGGQPVTYRHTPEGWTKVATRTAHYEHHVLEVHPWIEGSLLARRGYVPWYPGQEKWQGEDGPTRRQWEAAEAAIAKAKKLAVVRGAPKAPDVGPSLDAFASLATGEVFAATGGGSPSMLLLAADGKRTNVALPGSSPNVVGVVAEGRERAWVFGGATVGDTDKPYLVKVERGQAVADTVPTCKASALTSLSVLSDGTMWAVCGGPDESVDEDQDVWTRPADGPWERVTLPEGVDSATALVARAPDDVWVAAYQAKGWVLLHTRARSKVLEVATLEVLGRKVHEWNDLLPIDQHCGTGYVPLLVPPADATAVKTKLDADLRAFSKRTSVRLVRTMLREAPALGLQLTFESEATAADTKAVRKIAARHLGESAVGPARCWEATVADDGVLGAWDRPDPKMAPKAAP